MNSQALPAIEDLSLARIQGWRSQDALNQALDISRKPMAQGMVTRWYESSARQAARHSDQAFEQGLPSGPLSGVLVTIKDLYDVAGEVTLAGTRAFGQQPVATQDAPAVARLRQAGAVIWGKTNMTELAFSGIGINPHYGTPVNPADPHVARIPGGSSSGAAVSVALGLAQVGLGSDTGGSIRIPAAWCGVVGFKSSQHRVPITGATSLSHSLDTVCAMTRSVADARRVDGVLSGRCLPTRLRGGRQLRLAVPQNLVLDALDPTVARAYERALKRLIAAGAELVEVVWPEFNEIADIHAPAGFSAIECWSTHRHVLADRIEQLDPRVAGRLKLGIDVSAADYLRMCARRQDWIRRVNALSSGFDAWIAPTVPVVAPELSPLLASDDAFMATNRLSLRNTFVGNFMDGCSISLPMHQEGELPTGLMLTSICGQDADLLDVAQAVEALLTR
ncbi:MAG: amidase [Alphaproteobacteria bacterium]|nr:amidase [Alphaproteobacteria bacterium]